MLDCNKRGFLNGHTPFSAIVAFSSVLTAYLYGLKTVVLSNESSASESTVSEAEVNHQYSKSYQFERDFAAYEREYLHCGVQYFSLLREVLQTPQIQAQREIVRDLVRSMILYIHGLYDASFVPTHTLTRAEETVGRFMILVEQQSHAHHTIEWYASELCLSPKYMANLVKQVTGRSAGDCINAHLMAQAKWLLGSSSLSVLEISDRLGFQNQSHFGTFFKRHEGISPAAFRKKKE
jgi:AraC-like DNA-binding protein